MKTLLYPSLVILLAACSPLSKDYHKETVAQDLKAIADKDSNAATQVMVALMKRSVAELPVEGVPYEELAKEGRTVQETQKKREEEQKAEAAKVAAEEQARADRLSKAFNLTVYGINLDEGEYEKFQAVKVQYVNKSDKDIKAVKGSLTFTDLFDKELRSFNITMDDPLKAGSKKNDIIYYGYNQFIAEQTQLGSKSIGQVKAKWVPEKVIYADGSTLE